MTAKLEEIRRKIENQYVFKGRPSVLMLGINDSGCCGIGIKERKELSRLTSVEDLQGLDISELD